MRNRLKKMQNKMDKNWSKKTIFSGKSKKQDSTGKDQKKIRLRRSSLVHLQERRLCLSISFQSKKKAKFSKEASKFFITFPEITVLNEKAFLFFSNKQNYKYVIKYVQFRSPERFQKARSPFFRQFWFKQSRQTSKSIYFYNFSRKSMNICVFVHHEKKRLFSDS